MYNHDTLSRISSTASREMNDWSGEMSLKETLGLAENGCGEAYFDGDQHRLVQRQELTRSTNTEKKSEPAS